MEKTKTIVRIGGKDYTICGTESAEYIHRVALKVNEKFKEIKSANPDLNNTQLAMLTSINLADEHLKMQDELEATKKELEKLRPAPGVAAPRFGEK
ncbi:cell division protein ZapA [Christensenellaceae bacterium OttesenSCG-928-K19]|nr:cell division protein ZapA [Christensenellaceae bacterium OttesenSCG-928-K19]